MRRRPRAQASAPDAGRHQVAPIDHGRRHPRMRGQRPRAHVAAAPEPAVARRSRGQRGVDGDPTQGGPRGGRGEGRRGRRRVHRPGPRRAGRGRPVLRAQPFGRGGVARRGLARLRGQRRASAAAARLSPPPHSPRLVRHEPRQVAAVDHGRRLALPGIPAGDGLSLPHIGPGGRRAGGAHPSPGLDGPAGGTRLHVAPALRRPWAARHRRQGMVRSRPDHGRGAE